MNKTGIWRPTRIQKGTRRREAEVDRQTGTENRQTDNQTKTIQTDRHTHALRRATQDRLADKDKTDT